MASTPAMRHSTFPPCRSQFFLTVSRSMVPWRCLLGGLSLSDSGDAVNSCILRLLLIIVRLVAIVALIRRYETGKLSAD